MKHVVGKLEAAERQLSVAVDLYFRDGDPIAIHTLAAAAHGIVHDVNLARMRAIGEPAAPGFENLSVKDIPGALRERGIGAEFAPKVLWRAMNEAQNFLEHADDDPLGVLELDDRWTLLLLHDGCRLYRFLTGTRLPVLSAFEAWLFVVEPDGIERSDLPAELVEHLRDVSRLAGSSSRSESSTIASCECLRHSRLWSLRRAWTRWLQSGQRRRASEDAGAQGGLRSLRAHVDLRDQ